MLDARCAIMWRIRHAQFRNGNPLFNCLQVAFLFYCWLQKYRVFNVVPKTRVIIRSANEWEKIWNIPRNLQEYCDFQAPTSVFVLPKYKATKPNLYFGGVELLDFIIVTWELCSASYNVISFNPVVSQVKHWLIKVLQCVLFNTRDMSSFWSAGNMKL